MRMLSCLAPRDAGELRVLGIDPRDDPRALKRRLGVVAQETTLDLELTVRENLLVYARYFDIPRAQAQARALDLLALLALDDRADDAVDALSGGHAAAPADRARPHQPPPAGAPGRAHHRPRPAGPPRGVGAPEAAAQRGRHPHADDALHGRGGPAVRPARDHGPGAHRARGHPGRPGGAGGGARGAGAARGAGGHGRPRGGGRRPVRASGPTRWTATWSCSSATTPRPCTRACAPGAIATRLQSARPAGLEDVFLRLTGRRLRDWA